MWRWGRPQDTAIAETRGGIQGREFCVVVEKRDITQGVLFCCKVPHLLFDQHTNTGS